MADPLRLYWWRDTPNFGDAINPHIVAHFSGREVEWAPPETADLFATGSVMHFVRAAISSGRESRPIVWGSGCLNAMRRDFVPKVGFAALRGPLTREWLGLPPGPNGDPALLLPDVLGGPVPRADRVVVVPHFKQMEATHRAVAGLSDTVDVLDVRDGPLEVVRAIAEARLVFSSSLHGLIVADAFGVPSVWLNPEGNHRSPFFKFYDYATSIGRGLPRPVQLSELGAALRADHSDALPYQDGIALAQAELRASFPAALKAGSVENAKLQEEA